ncbi:hypothetical protein FACS189450_05270 [Spirochaetia bacterium]|nr:hypothetical protein FACS189450_05270 [Spirochaetia bacterium]
MIKTIIKLILCTVIYAIVFVMANALMPYSQDFKELGASGNSADLLFMLINAAWVCFTIYFIIHHTKYNGKKLFFNLLFIMFFVQAFMTQMETLFFTGAFPVLTKLDIGLIMAANLIPLSAVILLLIKFFQNKNAAIETEKHNINRVMAKLGIIGIIYLFVYMIFGYFVAWQFEELRIFYSNSAEKLGFFEHLLSNLQANPVIYPFQILRGILFGVFVLPLINMVNKNKRVFITSVCLVYLCTAVMLIIPNALFPDIVRIGHLIEMTGSMFLFGIITGNILWIKKKT